MEEKKSIQNEELEKVEDIEEISAKGALASSLIFVGGFIFLLYIAIYWLYMVRVDI